MKLRSSSSNISCRSIRCSRKTARQVPVKFGDASRRRRELIRRRKSTRYDTRSRPAVCYRAGTRKFAEHQPFGKNKEANKRKKKTVLRNKSLEQDAKNSHTACYGTGSGEATAQQVFVKNSEANKHRRETLRVRKSEELETEKGSAACCGMDRVQGGETTEQWRPQVPLVDSAPSDSVDSDPGCSASIDSVDSDPGCSASIDSVDSGPGWSATVDMQNKAARLRNGLKLEDCIVFMCKNCNTILGDFLKTCWEIKQLDVLVCLEVAKGLVWTEEIEFGSEGVLQTCAYKNCLCRFCGQCRGFIPYATPKSLAHLRDLFCLYKEGINCYCLKDGTTVPASAVNFYRPPLSHALAELKIRIVALHKRLVAVVEKVEEMSVRQHDNSL